MSTSKKTVSPSAGRAKKTVRSSVTGRYGTKGDAVRAGRIVARSAERYEAMADAVEAGEFRPVPGTLSGPLLKMGRPAADEAGRGKSPVRTVRLPHELDEQLAAYADGAHSTPSDVMRQAVAEYLDRHPLGA